MGLEWSAGQAAVQRWAADENYTGCLRWVCFGWRRRVRSSFSFQRLLNDWRRQRARSWVFALSFKGQLQIGVVAFWVKVAFHEKVRDAALHPRLRSGVGGEGGKNCTDVCVSRVTVTGRVSGGFLLSVLKAPPYDGARVSAHDETVRGVTAWLGQRRPGPAGHLRSCDSTCSTLTSRTRWRYISIGCLVSAQRPFAPRDWER